MSKYEMLKERLRAICNCRQVLEVEEVEAAVVGIDAMPEPVVRGFNCMAIASVLMLKITDNIYQASHTLHWRYGINDKSVMQDIAKDAAQKMKPEMQVGSVEVTILNLDELNLPHAVPPSAQPDALVRLLREMIMSNQNLIAYLTYTENETPMQAAAYVAIKTSWLSQEKLLAEYERTVAK